MSRMPLFLALGLTAAATGCAPLSLYHKPGVAVVQMDGDLTQCQVSALSKVPVNTQIRTTPIQTFPRTVCDRHGRCYTSVEIMGGQTYTVDANKRLRDKVEAQCMAEKGYAPVELPQCSSAISNAAPKAVTTVLPRLAPTSCVIRNADGSWQIVTPG
ncbi:hypothetical protein [Thalassovita taeanensis]|uniref:Lipoprotein n=1 Tax=Thalassovita taeanensis TaxID=657014 RepID=A0A1H8Z6C2_9RHOB|nr:hypothetical protein [Thalassovita taeanensis]SEP59980.1 hypothetical protein SAMN04488092_101317 [Thalassovita taeanensis]